MDIFGVGEGGFTTNQVLEASYDLATVVQGGSGNSGSIGCKVDAVEGGITGSQTGITTSAKPDREQEGGGAN